MAKHFVLDIRDGHVSFRRDDEKIAAEAMLDGIYVIRTRPTALQEKAFALLDLPLPCVQ